MPNLVAAEIETLLHEPCHTPRGNTISMWGECSALEFILQLPTRSSLPWHRHTAHPRHGVFLAHPHRTRFFPLYTSPAANCPGGEGQLPSGPSHPCLGSAFSGGQHQRWLKPLSVLWHRACHRRIKHLLITRQHSQGSPCPGGTESSSDQTPRVKDLYPLQFAFLHWVQGHSPLISLQSLSLYLTNDNTVNWIKTI